ncbi:beta strand repeat-containing protein [Labrys neptuniae]|uniref:DUF4214 domain-containing protein n=1 Tax=Labrys neptuniae TaxID=376174 RepID=A0ABV3PW81_9HYPH
MADGVEGSTGEAGSEGQERGSRTLALTLGLNDAIIAASATLARDAEQAVEVVEMGAKTMPVIGGLVSVVYGSSVGYQNEGLPGAIKGGVYEGTGFAVGWATAEVTFATLESIPVWGELPPAVAVNGVIAAGAGTLSGIFGWPAIFDALSLSDDGLWDGEPEYKPGQVADGIDEFGRLHYVATYTAMNGTDGRPNWGLDSPSERLSPLYLQPSNTTQAVVPFTFDPNTPLGWAADNGDFAAAAQLWAPNFPLPASYSGEPNTIDPNSPYSTQSPADMWADADRLLTLTGADPNTYWHGVDAAQATEAFLQGEGLPGVHLDQIAAIGDQVLSDLQSFEQPTYQQQVAAFNQAASAPLPLPSRFPDQPPLFSGQFEFTPLPGGGLLSYGIPEDFTNPVGPGAFYDGSYDGGFGGTNPFGGGSSPGWGGGSSPFGGSSSGWSFSGYPVVLDLNGKGIHVTPLSSSNKFFDMAGDGKQHRTAWAGAGNGVLVLDLNNSGVIDQKNEVDFTAWDPTAKTDMQALLDVFDTNHDGKLDAGDADWSKFKVMVTNADGTTSLETLADLGITSINLTTDNQEIVLPDGSKISGKTTYTKSDGSTGTAADASFAYDANGYLVTSTTSHNDDGSTSIDAKATNTDGSLASETISTVSSNGTNRTIKYDDNGDGVFDRSQTDNTVTNADGSSTETVGNYNADSSLKDRTVTTTSADRGTVTTQIDANGDGIWDQSQVNVRSGDGSNTATTKNLAANGSVINQTQVTTSADGLTKTTKTDHAGSGSFDQIKTDVTVVNADGSRTQTVSLTGSDGTLLSRSVTNTTADHTVSVDEIDSTGDGTYDTMEKTIHSVKADGTISTWVGDYNADGSERSLHYYDVSADGLTITQGFDKNSDGNADEVLTDATTIGADGTRTRIVTDTINGSLVSQTTTKTGANGQLIGRWVTGPGFSLPTSMDITTGADGSRTQIVGTYSVDGSKTIARTLTTTSADGLSKTTKTDVNADDTYDAIATDVTVKNADGSSTETVTDTSANGTLIDKAVITTSASGLTQTNQQDLDGNDTIDRTTTDAIVLNADGSRAETLSVTSNSGALLSKTVTVDSANRLTSTVNIDSNGDGHVDQTQVITTNADGSTTKTVSNFAANGLLVDKTLTTVSANGLGTTVQSDVTGDGVYDDSTSDAVALNADGSQTETKASYSGNGTLLNKQVVTKSGNGLSITTQTDANGDGTFDDKTSDMAVINANGSRTETISNYNGAGAVLLDQTIITTAADGLSKTTTLDINGDGTVDQTVSDTTVLNANGSTRRTVNTVSANGAVVNQIVTDTSASGSSVEKWIIPFDTNAVRTHEYTSVHADGSVQDDVWTYTADGSKVLSDITTITTADGLSKTVIANVSGNNAADSRTIASTTLNADGSKTVTASSYNGAGTILIGKTVTTTSANGLSTTVQSYLDNQVSPYLTTTDVKALNADGSTTETITTLSGANLVQTGKTVITVSVDGSTATTKTFVDANGAPQSISSQVTNPDGSKTTTQSTYNAAGTVLIGKTTTIISANGLTTTTTSDLNGDGVTDTTHVVADTLNADGSTIQTTSNYQGSSAAAANEVSQTVTTTSADGQTITTKIDANGDGVIDSVVSNHTMYNADGSKTETLSTYNGAGTTLIGRAVTTTSGNGLSIIKQNDVNGDGTVDQTVNDATVLNADGSKTETVSTRNAGGQLTGQTVSITSANGLTKTAETDANGDGGFDKIETIAKAADGSTVDTVSNYSPNGSILQSRTVTTTSGNGQTITVHEDANGDGVFDAEQATATIINADGSTTQTVTRLNGDGSALIDKTVTTTSADGLSKTVAVYLGNASVADQSTTDVTTVNADGSKTDTVTSTVGSDATQTDKVVTVTSADGLISTASEYANGSATATKTTTIARNGDGSTTQTVTAPSLTSAGANATSTVMTTTSASGLSKTTWTNPVLNSSGAVTSYTEKQSDVTVLNSDGTKTETKVDYNASGGVVQQEVITTSANGMIVNDVMTGTYPKASRDVTVLNADGSKTETITVGTSISGTTVNGIKDVQTKVTSANGLSETDTVKIGSVTDRITTTTTNLDGSKVETASFYSTAGALVNKQVVTTSADGLSKTIQEDSKGTGHFDSVETITIKADGSKTDALSNYSQSGALTEQAISTVSADGLTKTLTVDNNGDSIVDVLRKDVVTLNGDASRTDTISSFSGDGTVLFSKTTVQTSADGLSKTTQVDLDGNGEVDETTTDVTVVNTDGSTARTVTTTYADGTKKSGELISTSADGYVTTKQEDHNGDGTFDETVTSTRKLDGSVMEVDTATINGTAHTRTNVTSADGRVTTYSGTALDDGGSSTSYLDSNGSYLLQSGLLPAGFNADNPHSSTWAYANHNLDGNGVDSITEVDWYSPVRSTNQYYQSIYPVLDSSLEEIYLSEQSRIKDTSSDEDLSRSEKTRLPSFMANGVFNDGSASVVNTAGATVTAIEQYYQYSYARNASLAEMTSWLGQLKAGTITLGGIEVAIANSAEHIVDGNGHAENYNASGQKVSYVTDKAVAGTIVQRLFDTIFDRDPTASELTTYVNAIAAGTSTEKQVADAILSLPEFAQRYGTLSDADFLSQVFANTIGRLPSSTESTFWLAELSAGVVTRSDVVMTLADSAEHLQAGDLHGTATLDITGTGVSVKLGNAKITTEPGSSGTITGSGDNVTMNSVSTLSVVGNTNVVAVGSGSTLTITGTSETINATNANIVFGNSSFGTISGGGNAVTLGASDNISIAGANNVLTVKGSSDTISVSNSTVNVQNSISVSVTGNGDTINLATSDTLTASGSDLTVDVAGTANKVNVSNASIIIENGAVATVTGTNDSVKIKGNGQVTVSSATDIVDVIGASAKVTVTGGGGQITLEDGASATVVNNANMVTLNDNTSLTASGTGDIVNVTGAGNTITGSSETINVASGAGTTVTGAANTVNVTGNGMVATTGNTNTVTTTGSGATVAMTGASGGKATMSNGTLNLGSSTAVSVTGSGNAIKLTGSDTLTGSATGGVLDVIGTGNAATLSSAVVTVESGAVLTLTGTSDTVTLLGNAAQVTVSSATDTMDVIGTAAKVTVTGGNGVVTLENGASATVAGNTNAVTLTSNTSLTASGTGNIIAVNGTGNVISGASETINIAAGASATVTGATNTVGIAGNGSLNISGNTAHVTATGSGGSVTFSSGAGGTAAISDGTVNIGNAISVSVTGSNNTINFGHGGAVTVSGSNETFVFKPSFGLDTVTGYQASGIGADQINIDHSVFADWATLLSHTAQSGSDVIITADASDKITLKNTTVASLDQNNFHFT